MKVDIDIVIEWVGMDQQRRIAIYTENRYLIISETGKTLQAGSCFLESASWKGFFRAARKNSNQTRLHCSEWGST